MMNTSESAGKRASLINFGLTIGIMVAGFIYIMKTAYAGDPLWFWPIFNATPIQVEIRCRGERILLGDKAPETVQLARLVNEQISGRKQFDPLSLSEATHDYYRSDTEVVTLELIYADPVRVHLSTMYFSNITSLLIPLQGRYARANTVFGLINGKPAGGSLHVHSNQDILRYLNETALCEIQ